MSIADLGIRSSGHDLGETSSYVLPVNISAARIEANRRNATRSTGPCTAEGKARASRNSLRHGLSGLSVVLSDESRGSFRIFEKRLREELQPVGAIEDFFVERIISSAWRLRRVHEIERGILEEERFNYDGMDGGIGLAFLRDASKADAVTKLSRHEGCLERALFRSLHELQRLQAVRAGVSISPPVVVDVDVAVHADGT